MKKSILVFFKPVNRSAQEHTCIHQSLDTNDTDSTPVVPGSGNGNVQDETMSLSNKPLILVDIGTIDRQFIPDKTKTAILTEETFKEHGSYQFPTR